MPRKYIPQFKEEDARATTKPRRSMTLEEIADVFGTSRERIRQIEQNALRKIRGRLRAKGIDNLDDYLPD